MVDSYNGSLLPSRAIYPSRYVNPQTRAAVAIIFFLFNNLCEYAIFNNYYLFYISDTSILLPYFVQQNSLDVLESSLLMISWKSFMLCNYFSSSRLGIYYILQFAGLSCVISILEKTMFKWGIGLLMQAVVHAYKLCYNIHVQCSIHMLIYKYLL